jgi:hypothetical protein
LFAARSFSSHIVAIENAASSCPRVTVELPDGTIGAPVRVTLDLCEWRRIARDIADADEALGGCPVARRLRHQIS